MDARTVEIVIAIIVIVLFVPFYPFRLIKRFVFLIFNRFVPLPVKFDDIGGVPIIGMRLYGVRIQLGAAGTLEAEEMHVKLHFLRMLILRRPRFNPITFYRPRITVRQAAQKGGVWFLFPLNAMKQVISVLFSNLTGLNVIRIYGGTIIIEGKKGNTIIKDFNGEFTSHGSTVKLKRMSCAVGDGSIDIRYPERGPMVEGRVVVRNLHIQDLVALKVPRIMSGPMNIEAVMRGTVADMELVGYISSPCLYMRTEPIMDFRSPLHFKGAELTLENMHGHIGEYKLSGKLVTNVETDVSDLLLKGGGRGAASGSILRMLNLKPFISSSGLEAIVHLWGDLNEFYEFEGDIHLNLSDSRIDFSQIGEGTTAGFPLEPIPEAYIHMTLSRGVMKFLECHATSGTLLFKADGKIDMHFDEEEDKVTRSQFDLSFGLECADLKDLAAQFGARSLAVEGTCDGKFNMYADYSTIFHTLEGNGHILFTDARVKGLPIGKRTSLEGLMDVKFETIEGDIYLEKEGMGCRNVKFRSRWMDAAGDAWYGFFTKEINIDGDAAAIPNALKEWPIFKIIPWGDRIARRLRTHFSITGKTGKPKVKFRFGDTIRNLIGVAPAPSLPAGTTATTEPAGSQEEPDGHKPHEPHAQP